MKTYICLRSFVVASLLGSIVHAQQVNSGSDGHDGVLNPTADIVIDMADHPDGIYHYTSVNIPSDVTVSFIPNAGNKPVIWLVQGDCVIGGTVDVSGKNVVNATGGNGGPGGWRGGSAINPNPQAGEGPGGGRGGTITWVYNGAYGYNQVGLYSGPGSYATSGTYAPPEKMYGNSFILPLLGGSGGGGFLESGLGPTNQYGGGGGGGALLIACSGNILLDGSVSSMGGSGITNNAGSGGGVRMIAASFGGVGLINANGGVYAGAGRIRIDAMQSTFSGTLSGVVTQGFQPIIIPSAGQGVQLSIASIASNAVAATPSGVLANPDVIIPAQQSNPIPIVVNCSNIPLNTEVSVVVHPANGPDVQAVGLNNAGTLAASTATVTLNMPRGGGIIYAMCVSGVAGLGADTSLKELRTKSLAETGWTADGERFAKMEITAALGGKQQIVCLTESGKRFPMPQN